MGLQCWGAVCLILGIFSCTTPAGICGIIVGAMICCCPGDGGCLKCTSITGIVFAAIETAGCVIVGIYFVANVETLCGMASSMISGACAGVSGRRELVAAPSVGSLISLPVLHWTAPPERVTLDIYKKALNESHAEFFLGLADPKATKTLRTLPSLFTADTDTKRAPFRRLSVANDDSCRGPISDGDCDDGGPGSEFGACSCGTDFTDCGSRSSTDCQSASINPANADSCGTPDGDCDDGGPGSEYYMCTCGTDFTDCGSRNQADCANPTGPSQAESCAEASSTLDAGCAMWRSFSYIILIGGTVYSVAQLVSFSCVCCGLKGGTKVTSS